MAISAAGDASFLHDDITDKDITRRSRPAAWTVFGIAQALYAGCVLYHIGAQQLPGEALIREFQSRSNGSSATMQAGWMNTAIPSSARTVTCSQRCCW